MDAATRERSRDEAESLLLENLGLVDGLCRRVALRKALRGDEVADFAAWAKLRLVQDDYRILRRWRGESSLGGFLTTVLLRMALDYVREKRGSWRPSKLAQRSGPVAVLLETMIHRDGLSVEEAIAQLRANHGIDESAETLREMAARQRRPARPRLEGEEALEQRPDERRADERVEGGEVADLAARAAQALKAALAELVPEDALIVRLLFVDGFKVATAARQLGLEQRKLYTRRDAILRSLRRRLEASGLDAEQVARLCGWRTWSDALEPPEGDPPVAGPSPPPDGEATPPGEPP